MNKLIKLFWSNTDIQKARNGKNVYEDNNFVTEYAASEPEEDIAESFAYFIIDNKNSDVETKDKKVSYFYSCPELLSIRTEIRKGIYSDVIRSRRSSVN